MQVLKTICLDQLAGKFCITEKHFKLNLSYLILVDDKMYSTFMIYYLFVRLEHFYDHASQLRV